MEENKAAARPEQSSSYSIMDSSKTPNSSFLFWCKWCNSTQTRCSIKLVTKLFPTCSQHAPGSAVKEIIKGYDIKWSQEGKNWTDRKDSGQNQADVFINGGQYEFTVHAVVLSNSSVPAHITIPSQRENGGEQRLSWDCLSSVLVEVFTLLALIFCSYDCSNLPSLILFWLPDSLQFMSLSEILPVTKRLSSSAAAGFNLSWDEQHTVTCGYTVEWCILGNAEPCVLRWLKVPEGNNTLSLAAGELLFSCFPLVVSANASI